MHEDCVTYMSVKFVVVSFLKMWIEKWRGTVVNAQGAPQQFSCRHLAPRHRELHVLCLIVSILGLILSFESSLCIYMKASLTRTGLVGIIFLYE